MTGWMHAAAQAFQNGGPDSGAETGIETVSQLRGRVRRDWAGTR